MNSVNISNVALKMSHGNAKNEEGIGIAGFILGTVTDEGIFGSVVGRG